MTVKVMVKVKGERSRCRLEMGGERGDQGPYLMKHRRERRLIPDQFRLLSSNKKKVKGHYHREPEPEFIHRSQE